MLHKPTVQRGLIDAVMDTRIVEDDHGRSAIALTNEPIGKADDVGTFDRACARGIDEAVFNEVQRGNDVASAMMVGLDGMGQTPW